MTVIDRAMRFPASAPSCHAAHSGFWENFIATCRFEGRRLAFKPGIKLIAARG